MAKQYFSTKIAVTFTLNMFAYAEIVNTNMFFKLIPGVTIKYHLQGVVRHRLATAKIQLQTHSCVMTTSGQLVPRRDKGLNVQILQIL